MVLDVYQDRAGYMWFGTDNGLNQYDGYSFRQFPGAQDALSNKSVNDVYEDEQGRIWTASSQGAGYLDPEHYDYHPVIDDINCNLLARLDSNRMMIGTSGGLRVVGLESGDIQVLTTDNGLPSNSIRDIHQDALGSLWVLFPHGLARFDPATNRIESYRTIALPGAVAGQQWVSFTIDERGHYWLASDHHLVAYRPQDGEIEKVIPIVGSVTASASRRTFFVATTGARNVWIGTDRGLFVYNPDSDALRQHLKGDDQHGINNNEVRCFFADRQQGIWLGTYGGGINYHSAYNTKFDHFSHELNETRSSSENIVSGFATDGAGKLWIATWGDGLKFYDAQRQRHASYHFANGRFGNEVFRSVTVYEGGLWAATNNNGLVRVDLERDTYRHFTTDNGGLASNTPYCTHAGLGDLWVGLGGGAEGLQRYVPRSDDLETISLVSPQTQQTIRYVRTIADDGDRHLFLGTHGQGLWVYDTESGTIRQYTTLSEDPLSNDVVYSLHYDPRGYLWIGTMVGGLNRLHLATGRVVTITKEHGLPNNCINGILPDNSGNLWISTNQGLSRFTPPPYLLSDTVTNDYVAATLGRDAFVNFTAQDGLQSNEFKYGAYFRCRNGILYFGGINGYNRFDPKEILTNPAPPPVVITDIRVFDQDAWPDSRRPEVVRASTGDPESLRLPHDQNLLTIDYAALNYSQSSKNKYAYYLEGYDNNWRYVGTARKASYTNLPPGQYTFRVKASNNDGIWNEQGAALGVTIVPPIWARTWVQVVCVFLLVSLLFFYYRYRLHTEKRKTRRMEAAVEARTRELAGANLQLQEKNMEIEAMWEKVHDADQQKLRFFTNVSHEFRTPLTLIIGPLEDLLKGNRLALNRVETLEIIHKNALRLLHLINELLNLRSLETGASTLQLQHTDLDQFLRSLVANFRYHSDLKGIMLSVDLPEQVVVWLDPGKMEKVFFNLLGNAVKFTERGGRIAVTASLDDAGLVRVTVANSSYIPADRLELIFDRYVKSTGESADQGSGIGLALVKELVDLHQGRVEVSSCLTAGTKFTVVLPQDLAAVAQQPTEVPALTEAAESTVVTAGLVMDGSGTNRAVVLIAEDDPDLRTYLRSLFEPDFTVITAENGRTALELAQQHIPDFVISDFMMPEMDGLEFCQALRSDQKTSHIPIIMVTARTVEEDKLAGLKVGVDDYITKPFSSSALKLKVGNILARRKAMQERLRDISQIYQVNPDNETETSFYKELIAAIEANLADEAFNTSTLAEAMNMSRSQLYRKILAVVNRPASELIREIRMKHAEAKLLNTDEQVSTIAYSLGFKSVSHFTKTFSATYGIPPTKFRSERLAAQ